ncbi:potassium transporter KefB [Adhaeribacter radiodurans]|uniref:Potassium transporter KefB n=1 Tax=Adhaeribacter radiodurans TaxID=2745197 RepID=A0A7L7LDP9_9BACT|nr:potassium transporter KefB [Adhaeribacter radiodurans]QMU30903.1 potassium transporter KefB [Adhaeribacter radiodurans]
MTEQNKSQNQSIYRASFVKPVVVGAGIALLVISFFVFGVDNPHPEWGKFWQVRPLIITPLAGAIGGAFYSFLDYQSSRGFNRTVAILLSIVVYLIGLWLGIVLGLAGTMWD